MDMQNLTISIDKTLLKKAKITANRQDKSLSELIRESLKEKIGEENGYKEAKRRYETILKKGLNLGTNGNLKIIRDELYVRK